MSDDARQRNLVVVSNRLPVRLEEEEDGQQRIVPSPGGLVTALNPVLNRNKGTWVGWIGTETEVDVDELLRNSKSDFPYQLKSIPLTEEEENLYYRGFSNETIWPLFHDLLGYCKFDNETWLKYQEINERFADKVAEVAEPDDFIWVHDYQLCLVGKYLRRKGLRNPLLFFLHIPFPSPDLYRRLPWRQELIEGLVEYDTLGFHTHRDRENFVNSVESLFDSAERSDSDKFTTLSIGNRRVRAGSWPISIDYNEFNEHAASKEVADAAWLFHEAFGPRTIILGLDRLDYTKGIPERFLAFERLLEKYPDVHEQVSLYQTVVPSRTHVPDYQDLKKVIDELVGRINGRYSRAGWIPVHYTYRSFSRTELIGRYRACEIALITPLRDGMNLVCKEYCSSCVDNRGVLILSEFAGAAEELQMGALLVNPYDVEKTADAIYQAIRMNPEERQRRMTLLREHIRQNDVHQWVESIKEAVSF